MNKQTTRDCKTMAAQLTGDGPIALSQGEANALRAMLRQMIKLEGTLQSQGLELSNINTAMVAALKRNSFRLTHQEHDDGTITFDLENVPQRPDEPVSVN